jgi:AcrR family transcriptional regulator
LRSEQVEATRRAIVASARRLFGARGYAATSIDEIARDARVTKGAVYHHFDTKEELFRSVYLEVEGEAQSRTGAAIDPEAPPVDQIIQAMHGYLDATLDPEVQRITLVDAPAVLGLEPEGPAEAHAGFVAVREFVADGIRSGALRRLDAGAVAHLIRGSLLQAGLFVAHAADAAEARRQVGAVAEAMLRGLAQPAGEGRPTTARRRRS